MTLTASSQTTELAYGMREAVSACVGVLRDVVAGLDPDALLADEAPEVWGLFDEVERLGAAGKILVAHRVEESSAWKEAGTRSAAEYLALRGGTTREVARDALKTSERLRKLAHTQDALRRGELSTSQAHAIADVAAVDPTAESALLGHAKTASLKELKDECLRRKAAAEPDPNKKRQRIHKDRYFRLTTDPEGAWRFFGRGPLDQAGTFGATLNPLIDDQFKKARAEGRRDSRDAHAYDALQEMARLARAMYYGDTLPDDDLYEDAASGQTSAGEPSTDAGTSGDTGRDTAGGEPEDVRPADPTGSHANATFGDREPATQARQGPRPPAPRTARPRERTGAAVSSAATTPVPRGP